jgi:hypothetical protein
VTSGYSTQLTPHRFIFATESTLGHDLSLLLRELIHAGFGGHYAPAFVTYFDEQNAKIDAGTLEAERITVSAIMINKSFSFFSSVHTVFPWSHADVFLS